MAHKNQGDLAPIETVDLNSVASVREPTAVLRPGDRPSKDWKGR
jgi:hypothetical protein